MKQRRGDFSESPMIEDCCGVLLNKNIFGLGVFRCVLAIATTHITPRREVLYCYLKLGVWQISCAWQFLKLLDRASQLTRFHKVGTGHCHDSKRTVSDHKTTFVASCDETSSFPRV
jgi:hypothetical protein